jgi:hypothetical protein
MNTTDIPNGIDALADQWASERSDRFARRHVVRGCSRAWPASPSMGAGIRRADRRTATKRLILTNECNQ